MPVSEWAVQHSTKSSQSRVRRRSTKRDQKSSVSGMNGVTRSWIQSGVWSRSGVKAAAAPASAAATGLATRPRAYAKTAVARSAKDARCSRLYSSSGLRVASQTGSPSSAWPIMWSLYASV